MGTLCSCMIDLGFYTFRQGQVSAESRQRTGVKDCGWSGSYAVLWGVRPGRFSGGCILSTKTEKYGRFLVDLYRPSDEKSLNMELLATGHAVAYEG
jgi:hypothetical protein